MGEVWIDAGDAAGAGALAGWLRRDPGMARSGVEIEAAGPTPSASPEAGGAMGAVETVTAVVNSTVGVFSLLIAVAAWRRPRGVKPPLVRVIEDDGTVVEGTAKEVLDTVRARRERERPEA
ncbi:hypothetical protein AB0I84_26850 [Streptomyces spectabilis]|uniref:effector-associated constant component EACC1 n=1 Tax=Streptomyces spectabilis TaxID=68270 RepID=UPI0033D60C16